MLVSILSVKGSPGVTSFAVALAARWPGPARTVVVEADPSGGDLGLRFSLPATRGLVSLAAAARHSGDRSSGDHGAGDHCADDRSAGRGGDGGLMWSHALELPGGLAVVIAPPDAEQARAALSALAPATTDPHRGSHTVRGARRGVLRVAADAPDTVVIADCGRADPGSPALSIARSSDAVIVLSRAHADDLAHLPRRLDAIATWSPAPVLLLVGKGYPIATVGRELGVTPLARIPHDPVGAQTLCGRPHRWRWGRTGPSRSALGQTAHDVALTVATRARSAASDAAREGRFAVLRSVPGAPTVAVPPPLPPRTGTARRGAGSEGVGQ